MTLALYIAAGVVYSAGIGVIGALVERKAIKDPGPAALFWPVIALLCIPALPGWAAHKILTRPKRPTLPTARVRDE